MKKDHYWLKTLASLAAGHKPFGRARVVAGIVYRGELIATGYNRSKTHPLQARYGRNPDAIFLHAETDALVQVTKTFSSYLVDILPKSTLYIARAKWNLEKTGMIVGMAKPCDGCQRAIEKYNLGRVVWTGDSDELISWAQTD